MLVYAAHAPTKDAPLNPDMVREFVKQSNVIRAFGALDNIAPSLKGLTSGLFGKVDDSLNAAGKMLGRMEDMVPTSKLPSAGDSLPTGKFNPLMRSPGAKTNPMSAPGTGTVKTPSPRQAAPAPRYDPSAKPVSPRQAAPSIRTAVTAPTPATPPPFGQKLLPKPGQKGFEKMTPEQQFLAQPNPTSPRTVPTPAQAVQMDALPGPGQKGFDKLTPEQQFLAQPNPTPNSPAARQANLDELASRDAQRAAERANPRGNAEMYGDPNIRSVRDQVSRMGPEQQAAAVRQVLRESGGTLSPQARQVFLDAGMDTESINAAMKSQTVAIKAADDVAAAASAFRIADDVPSANRAQEASRLAGEFAQSAPANSQMRGAVRNMGGADLDIPAERLVQLQSENPQLFNQIQQAKILRDQELARAIRNGVDVTDPTTLAAINDLSARKAGLARSSLTHADQPTGLLGRNRQGVAQSQQALEDARIDRYVSMAEQSSAPVSASAPFSASAPVSAPGQGIINSMSEWTRSNPLPALGVAGLAGGVTGAAVDGE